MSRYVNFLFKFQPSKPWLYISRKNPRKNGREFSGVLIHMHTRKAKNSTSFELILFAYLTYCVWSDRHDFSHSVTLIGRLAIGDSLKWSINLSWCGPSNVLLKMNLGSTAKLDAVDLAHINRSWLWNILLRSLSEWSCQMLRTASYEQWAATVSPKPVLTLNHFSSSTKILSNLGLNCWHCVAAWFWRWPVFCKQSGLYSFILCALSWSTYDLLSVLSLELIKRQNNVGCHIKLAFSLSM